MRACEPSTHLFPLGTPSPQASLSLGTPGRVRLSELMPIELGGSLIAPPEISVDLLSLAAITEHIVEDFPLVLEEWFYFDGLLNSSIYDIFEAGTEMALGRQNPFPDPDPGLQLRGGPDEDLLLYSFTVAPLHAPTRPILGPSNIYSVDTYPTTGKVSEGAMLPMMMAWWDARAGVPLPPTQLAHSPATPFALVSLH